MSPLDQSEREREREIMEDRKKEIQRKREIRPSNPSLAVKILNATPRPIRERERERS